MGQTTINGKPVKVTPNRLTFGAVVIVINTTSTDEIFNFKLTNTAKYKCIIHWGDSSVTAINTVGSGELIPHTYTNAGNYTIRIFGVVESLSFAGNTQIIRMLSWGNKATNLKFINFHNCSELLTLSNERGGFMNLLDELGYKNDNNRGFSGCLKLTHIPTGLFAYNTNITTLEGTFAECPALKSIDENMFNTNPNIVNFKNTFACKTHTPSPTTFPTKIFNNQTGDIDFTSTFDGRDFTGTVPELWNLPWSSTAHTNCFNGTVSAKNSSIIPVTWN